MSEVKDLKFQYRKRYEITCDDSADLVKKAITACFNTASGMRSHVTKRLRRLRGKSTSFNTASGMRSHVTSNVIFDKASVIGFQYRKRYEVTCDSIREFTVLSW